MGKYTYGPVASRRLGFSLGVDLVPYKTCSFDCVYCQLGHTTKKTVERKEYVQVNEVFSQLKETLSSSQKVDYITFSGSGEPTLHSEIGWLIREIKKFTHIPVAVITNGSLLFQKEVRKALLKADLVIPSLNAVSQETFNQINNPHPSLTPDKIVEGIKEFKKEFKNKLWLEIMLVKGINDSAEQIKLLKSKIEEIKPDKIQLNTVIRPPAEPNASPLSFNELKKIKGSLGENCEIISSFKRERQKIYLEDKKEAILSLIKRRPVTLSDISSSLGIPKNEVIKFLEILEKKGEIKKFFTHQGLIYYKKEEVWP